MKKGVSEPLRYRTIFDPMSMLLCDTVSWIPDVTCCCLCLKFCQFKAIDFLLCGIFVVETPLSFNYHEFDELSVDVI